MKRYTQRNDELNTLVCSLYENFVNGKLPEKQYQILMDRYAKEQDELDRKIADLNEKVNHHKTKPVQPDRFIELIKQYKDVDNLSRDLVSHLTGISHNHVLRKLIMDKEIRQRPDVDFLALVTAVDRLGNNINQIAKKANTNNAVSYADMKEVSSIMRRIRSEMNAWKEQSPVRSPDPLHPGTRLQPQD